jgi:uncharacterized protein (TIGR03790 family)
MTHFRSLDTAPFLQLDELMQRNQISIFFLLSLSLFAAFAQVSCSSGPDQASDDSRRFAGDSPLEGDTPLAGDTPSSSERFFDFDLRESALILFNKNLSDSIEVALYYAQKREIDEKFLCGVNAPIGDFITLDQFRGIRAQIIKNCICEILPASQKPNPCDADQIDQIASLSRIRSLVLIHGLPLRLFQTGWNESTCAFPSTTAEQEGPLFDFVLSRSLFGGQSANSIQRILEHNESEQSTIEFLPNLQSQNFDYLLVRNGMSFPRPISAYYDQRLAYGRIQSLSVERAKALIDRTIAAEKEGFQGNVVLGLKANDPGNLNHTPTEPNFSRWSTLDYFQQLFGEDSRPECRSYLFDDHAFWNSTQCRVGANPLGHIPGELGGKIQTPSRVGIFLSGEYAGNNQRPFDGQMENLLRWRRSDENCTPLCRDLPTEIERENCRNSSLDYFREINTQCVGGAKGLMGWQYRSYTATSYALNPLGWEGTESGHHERTGVKIISDGGFQNKDFNDSSFVRWGHKNSSAQCINSSEEIYECHERLAIRLKRMNSLSTPLSTSESHRFRLQLRYRNSGRLTENMNPSLRLTLKLWGPGGQWHQPEKTLPLSEANDEWTHAEFLFETNPAQTPNHLQAGIDRVEIYIRARHDNQMEGYFDLDALELDLIDENSEPIEQILSREFGGFSSPISQSLPHGEWPATVIERMGGIGYWGSANHNHTCGHAFLNSGTSMRYFFAGRSLGESLMKHDIMAASGFVFADPLYRPSAAFLYLDKINKVGLTPQNPIQIDPNADSRLVIPIKVNAFHGTARLAETKFEIRLCHHFDESCVGDIIFSHQGAVYGKDLPIKIEDLLIPDATSTPIQLQLKVWNPNEPDQALYSKIFFLGQPIEPVTYANNPDLNSDGVVDAADLVIFYSLLYSGDLSADFNGDGIVDMADFTILLASWTSQ